MWGMNEEGERKREPGDCPLVTTLPLAAARRRGYTKKGPRCVVLVWISSVHLSMTLFRW